MEMKKSNWKNLGGDLRMYIPSRSIYAVKSFRYLGIPNLFHSFGPISEREARRLLPGTIENWKAMHVGGKTKAVIKTVGEVIPFFLKYETPKNRRERTIQNHHEVMGEIDFYFGDMLLDDPDFEDSYFDRLQTVKADKARIAEERRRLRKGGIERKTFDYLAVFMNMLMNYAYRKKYCSHRVKIPFTDKKQVTGRAIDHATAKALYAEMSEEAKDIYMLAYMSCMRRNEGLRLTWDRFDLKTGLITLHPDNVKTGSRTKRGRSLFVRADVLERFRARYERQKHLNSPWVFPSPRNPNKPQGSVKKAWSTAKRKAGISGKLRWHDLRHSGISYLINELKWPINDVSQFVGTSVRILQQVYLHTQPEHTRGVAQAISLND